MLYPKQPFYDWLVSVFPDHQGLTAEDLRMEPTLRLVAPVFAVEEAIEAIMANWRHHFTAELYGWVTDELKWPKRLTKQQFREWFDLVVCSEVCDLSDLPLEREDQVITS
jgi:hypothetical protein